MPKNTGSSGSSCRSGEVDPDIGIRASASLPTITEESEGSAISMAALSNEVDVLQSLVRQHADVMGQIRLISEDVKKLQADCHLERMECLSDKEELKSLILE